MGVMKKILTYVALAIFSLILFVYLAFLFVLPAFVNNKSVTKKLENILSQKFEIQTTISDLNLKTTPNLKIFLNVKEIKADKSDVNFFNTQNLSLNFDLKNQKLVSINSDNIYINGDIIKKIKPTKKEKKKSKFKAEDLPLLSIKNFVYKSKDVNVNVKDIKIENNLIGLKAKIESPTLLKEPIQLGSAGNFKIDKDKIYADNFVVELGSAKIYINGIVTDKNKTPNFTVKGKNLLASEIMPMLLHFQKSLDPSKKFIENFKDFNGTVNLDLQVNSDGIWGKGITNNLSAKAVWFDIPLYFKEAVFNFRGTTIDSVAEGLLGREKVIHTLNITDLLDRKKKLVVGTVSTTLTKKFDYVPNLTVLNSVNVSLVYKIKLRKPDVYYNIDIPVNSDLIYNSFYLGLRNYKRKLYANTFKDDNDLYLKQYKYSYSNSNKENIILLGDGLFKKNVDKKDPDKFIPQFITCHTNGYAPISVTGSFGEKVKGGEFGGYLKYDFVNNQVLGTFDIIKARHKAFQIDKAHIMSNNGVFNVTSNGFFKGEKYMANLSLKNNIFGETIIYDMKMFLDKLVLETTPQTNKPKKNINPNDLTKKVKEAEMTINKWELAINEIKRDKFVLNNVKIIGSLKNNIFDFSMKDMQFADGIIHAKGIYDFAKNTSKMSFEAKNINSNKVAEMTLNLKDQIEGIAQAKVELSAKDMFRFLDAHCMFEVKEGFLPKLGDKEFMIKDTKYKISQITNFDLTQKDMMKDDIKGTFDVHNTKISNINLTTWHELSAIFLEGSYDMEKQYADLHMFWHYSKEAPKGIRIFGVPLSFILKVVFRPERSKELYQSKLSKIPHIKADEKHSSYYRIQLSGDINNNKTNLVLKEIR